MDYLLDVRVQVNLSQISNTEQWQPMKRAAGGLGADFVNGRWDLRSQNSGGICASLGDWGVPSYVGLNIIYQRS